VLDTKIKVGIIDLGINNIHSIVNAYLLIGCKVKVISKKENLFKYNIIVLPGVGSFKSAIKKLTDMKIIFEIKNFIEKNPNNILVGICLGMQLFFDESLEFGYTKGTGLIRGKVLPFNKKKCKTVPHMNWNSIKIKEKTNLFGRYSGKKFYFVHSYYCQPFDLDQSICQTNHNGQKFCSMVRKENIIGLQFHPEKSGIDGINLLQSINKLT
tara:strand:- start:106 stop:738 length:633 start_codon:yes stop_codon:yes gene_type:complete